MPPRAQTVFIRQFIVENVTAHPQDIAAVTSRTFKISRQAVNRHLREMENSGVLLPMGRTRSKSYALREIDHVVIDVQVSGLEEHIPWQNTIKDRLTDIPRNVYDVCSYGFHEMLNNVISHSESPTAQIEFSRTAECVNFVIRDSGVGIFKKIRDGFGLRDELEAITELAKGKLTTDPKNHSGEGIFFTSRMFDVFSILSGCLYFQHTHPENDWLLEDRVDETQGTHIRMTISQKSKITTKKVYAKFTSRDGESEFSKTHIPIRLFQFGTDNLVSRSQARRVLTRFEQFREIILDFDEVASIGQAFADEIFRVYQNEHPDVHLHHVNTSRDTLAMIRRAVLRRQEEASYDSHPEGLTF